MTQQQARTTSNLILGLGAAGAAYYVLRTPSARRAVWNAARLALRASGPWLIAETLRGWEQSANPPRRASAGPAR